MGTLGAGVPGRPCACTNSPKSPPCSGLPQHRTHPPDSMPQLTPKYSWPKARTETKGSTATVTGVVTGSIDPGGWTCPAKLFPQQRISPETVNAQACPQRPDSKSQSDQAWDATATAT